MSDRKKFYCQNCKTTSGSGAELWEGDTGAIIALCPLCGSGSMDMVQACNCCGSLVSADEEEDVTYCRSCIIALNNCFQQMLAENFTQEECRKLNELYDGREF
ncbi:MAG: hypothetical protein Q4C00_03040 [Bacillota bacterium]|nr:hypothetical protein [Bacillota bacterium]